MRPPAPSMVPASPVAPDELPTVRASSSQLAAMAAMTSRNRMR